MVQSIKSMVINAMYSASCRYSDTKVINYFLHESNLATCIIYSSFNCNYLLMKSAKITHDCKTDFDLVVSKVMLPDGETITDIGIKRRFVTLAFVKFSPCCNEENVIDCKNFHVLPGVIDSQVHFREPGLENKENWSLV